MELHMKLLEKELRTKNHLEKQFSQLVKFIKKEKINNISKYGQEIIDRDLIIFYENNENIYYNFTLVPKTLKESIMFLTSQYQIDRKMILIGKDGGVKRVFSSSDQIHKVFDLIDTMPMRKIEMRRE